MNRKGAEVAKGTQRKDLNETHRRTVAEKFGNIFRIQVPDVRVGDDPADDHELYFQTESSAHSG